MISQSQSSFEIERVKRCTEISPSVPRTLTKSARESNSRSRRGLSFDAIPAQQQSLAEKEVNNLSFVALRFC